MWNQQQMVAYFVLNLGIGHPVIVRTLQIFVRPQGFVEELFVRIRDLFEQKQSLFQFTQDRGKDFATLDVQPRDTLPSASNVVLQANLFKGKTSEWTLRLQFWDQLRLRKKFYVFSESNVLERQPSWKMNVPVKPDRLLNCILTYYQQGGVIKPYTYF